MEDRLAEVLWSVEKVLGDRGVNGFFLMVFGLVFSCVFPRPNSLASSKGAFVGNLLQENEDVLILLPQLMYGRANIW